MYTMFMWEMFKHSFLFQLALSSDKLGSLQEPLFSLDLHINEGGVRNTENIELSKDELRNLVSALDSANKVVLQLRT